MKNEAALQANVLARLRGIGGKWENRSPGAFSAPGVPDIIGCFLGRYVAIELKNPNTHRWPSATDKRWPAQRAFLRDVFAEGGCALATNNVNGVVLLIEHIQQQGGSFYLEIFL